MGEAVHQISRDGIAIKWLHLEHGTVATTVSGEELFMANSVFKILAQTTEQNNQLSFSLLLSLNRHPPSQNMRI